MTVSTFIEQIKIQPGYRDQIVHVEHLPSRQPSYQEPAHPIHAQLESALRESPDPATRLSAFRVLRALPGDAAARAATILVRDPDPGVRGEAEEVLREPGGGTGPG